MELASREESIRLDAIRRAEVQRMTLLMQQQATAEKAFEAEQRKQKGSSDKCVPCLVNGENFLV